MIEFEGFPTRILVVDDKRMVRESLAMRIERTSSSYMTEVADGGEEALARLAEHEFDVVLCDLRLKTGMNGIELTRRITDEHPTAKVVVFSGVEHGTKKKEVLLAGALFFLSKPLDEEELLNAIAKINAIRRTERQSRAFEKLAQISYDLQATFNFDRIAERIVDGALELGYSRARLYILESETQTLVGYVARGMGSETFEGYRIPLESAPVIHKIFEQDRPTYWNHEIIEEHFGKGCSEQWVNDFDLGPIDWMDCPLLVRNRRVGTLAVDFHGRDGAQFTEDDRQILGIFSNMAAQSLRNSSLYTKEALSKASLQSVLRDAPDAVITTDLDGTITFASQSCAQVLGRTPEAMKKRKAADFYLDEAGTEGSGLRVARRLMRELRNDGVISNQRVYFRGIDGFPQPISLSGSLLRDDRQQEIGTLGILKDLGPFEEQTQQYHDMLEGFGYGTLLLNAKGKIGFVNRKAQRLFRRERHELLGVPFQSLIRPAGREDFVDRLKQVSESGSEAGLDLHVEQPGGRQPLPIHAVLTPARLGRGQPGVAVALQDKTELELLIRTGRLMALGQMVAGVGHEINNPVNHILLAAGMARDELTAEPVAGSTDAGPMEDGSGVEGLVEYLDMILRNGRRIRGIVGQLREFARPGELANEPLDVNTLIRRSFEFFGTRFANSQVTIDMQLGANLPAVRGDMARMQQVLINLIVNAEDAMEGQDDERRLEIHSRREGDGVAIDVTDSGPGVPDEVKASIFDPFYTTKPPNRGTGLGLSICKSIVETYGGTIRVMDAESGRGARFTVVLPVVSGKPYDES